MKKHLLAIFISLILNVNSNSQTYTFPGLIHNPGINLGELLIINNSDYPGYTQTAIIVRIYPKGAVFNGAKEYSPLGKSRRYPEAPLFYLSGGDIGIQPGEHFAVNFDDDGPGDFLGNDCKFNIGFGLYVIEFWNANSGNEIDTTMEMLNSFEIDWRNFFFRGYTYTGNGGNMIDIRIDFISPEIITFRHFTSNGGGLFQDIRNVNKYIKMWDLYGVPDSIIRYPYSNGPFSEDINFTDMPIDFKPYYEPGHYLNPKVYKNYGELGSKISISENISTQNSLINNPTNITVSSHCYLMLENGKLFDMITPTIGSYNNLIIEDSAYLIVRPNAKVNLYPPNRITIKENGNLVLNQSSEIVIYSGAMICNEGGRMHIAGKITYKGLHQMCADVADFSTKDSSKIFLSDSATVELPDDFTLRISGSKSSLIMSPHSKMIFGENAKIVIDSGATLSANNASFISADTSETWEGIILNNSGVDSIINCTFTNAKTSLSIINDANHSNTNRIIKGNTFNIPAGEVCRGIYGENNYRLLVQNNTFNMPVASSLTPDLALVGLYLKNSSTGGAAGEPEESEVGPYSLNIVGNTFNNGCASAILANYLSNLLPYNIKHNTFNYASSVNFIGMQIEGRIKNNSFTSDEVPIGIHLISSNPDLYNNSIEAKEIGVHMTGNCYPRMAPYVSGSDQVWVGGVNTITTSECDNIQLESAGNIFTDWGNNSFNLLEDSTYHIYGFVDSSMHAFYTRDNCWNSTGTPALSLTKNNSQWIVPAVYYNAGLDCLYSPDITGYNVINLGNGIVDSVRLTTDYTSYEPSEEEILLYTSQSYMGNQDYPNAIATLKALIDTDTSFAFIAIAVDDLYGCYNALDTNDQNHRNDLFIDLIYFLEPKILSEEYPTEFNEAAYDVLLMSYAKLGEYESTMEGYGMLAIYHPDPNIRLSASWNYSEIEDLIELGEGGGFKGDINNAEEREAYDTEMISKLNKKINDNPLSKVIKRSFDKMNEEKKTKTENELKSAQSKSEKSLIIRNKEIDNQKEERAKRNMLFSKNMTKLESEKRRMEDLSITIMNTRKLSAGNSLGNIVPLEYKLSQNYPNPFNPVTRIDFQLPKDVNVKIKVYDVSGREIQTLVNEFKQAGSYNVSFDGSNLSSGVYFYRIEAGDFVQTKRMVLLK